MGLLDNAFGPILEVPFQDCLAQQHVLVERTLSVTLHLIFDSNIAARSGSWLRVALSQNSYCDGLLDSHLLGLSLGSISAGCWELGMAAN